MIDEDHQQEIELEGPTRFISCQILKFGTGYLRALAAIASTKRHHLEINEHWEVSARMTKSRS
jgi:hypothetical protein